MSQELNEDLSCLIDGELETDKSGFLLRRLSHDAELKGSWRRYHMYGEIMRRESLCRVDLTAAVAKAVDLEPEIVVSDSNTASAAGSHGSRQPRWIRPVAGAAIAASVAVFAFNMFSPQAPSTNGARGGSAPIADATANLQTPPTLQQRATPASATSDGGAWSDPKLQSYIMRHNEAAARRGQGLVPYIYLVSTPADGNDGSSDTAEDGDVKDSALVQP